MQSRSTKIIRFKWISTLVHKFRNNILVTILTRIMQWSLQKPISCFNVLILLQEILNQGLMAMFGGDMKRRTLAILLHVVQYFLDVVFAKVCKHFVDITNSNYFHEILVEVVVASSLRPILYKPMHVELAPLELLYDFGMIVGHPVLLRILFEVC